MKDQNYGEFNSFDEFFEDLVKDLYNSEEADVSPESEITDSPRRDDRADARISADTKSGNGRKENKKMSNTRNVSGSGKKSGETGAAAVAGTSSNRKPVLFFLAIIAVTVLAWCLPLRPTVSVSEKRNLDRFPEYSIKTLVSGEYFRSIENWFSDTFTFREKWIKMGDGIKKLYGIQSIAIYGDMPVVDAIPIPAPVQVETVPDADEETDKIEEIAGTEATEEIESSISTEPVAVPEEEDEWGGVVIDEEALIAEKGAKLQIDDHIFLYPGFNAEYAKKYADKISSIATKIKDRANFYCIVAPHSVSSMLTREDREKYGFVIEEDALDYIYGSMNSDVITVNVLPNLQKHNSEYIVFKSDPHWTALGAYYAYEAWCDVAGKEPVPLSEYKEYAWEDFFGTYYYTAGQPKEIRNNPDIVYAYEPPGDVHLYLDFTNRDKLGVESPILLDRSTMKVDQYITFLGTDSAAATFINNSIEDDSAVLVLKTSFGNPFVYYLTQHYHTVYIVDIRSYKLYSVSQFLTKHSNVTDVILIHATDLCYYADGVATAAFLLK